MSARLGNHRLRPALSNAARAKASIKVLQSKLADARRIGAGALVAKLETELAWAIANSLAP